MGGLVIAFRVRVRSHFLDMKAGGGKERQWRMASDTPGSGNTTNIGSIYGNLDDFKLGNTPFESETEFLDYWRNYEKTAELRKLKFSNIREYRSWKQQRTDTNL
ncbi:MAG: hypothetical protein N5P05_000829 [Chroococcopsis gigantea SAG 12.99]|jgi:hypothetical protein|nr:hypothetical protein [Chlorogloea purpurea SAG 13.99]MDV2999223.1 hypothetical protein [Chroococcopsis gigantea SAG 12.99]